MFYENIEPCIHFTTQKSWIKLFYMKFILYCRCVIIIELMVIIINKDLDVHIVQLLIIIKLFIIFDKQILRHIHGTNRHGHGLFHMYVAYIHT